MCLQCRPALGDQDLRLMDADTKKLALEMYAEGIAARTIERLFKVSYNNARGWVRKEVEDTALKPLPSHQLQVVEADGCRAALVQKTAHLALWSIACRTHQMVGFALGCRGIQTAKRLQPQRPTDSHLPY